MIKLVKIFLEKSQIVWLKSVNNFLNGKQYMISMRFLTQNPFILLFFWYFIIFPEIIKKKLTKKHLKKWFYKKP